MFQFYDPVIQGMYLIHFEIWTEYDLLISEWYFWFAQIKKWCNTPSLPSWFIDSLKIINWVWSTRFKILFPISWNKMVNQNHDFRSWFQGCIWFTWIGIRVRNHDSDSQFYLSESETGFRIGWIILSLGPTGALDLPESETWFQIMISKS